MLGTFQPKNVITAIEAAEVLIKLPIEELKNVVNKGIEKTRFLENHIMIFFQMLTLSLSSHHSILLYYNI